MWVSQTYLSASSARAKAYAYLLLERYRSGDAEFEAALVENLRLLGKATGSKSAFFVPDQYSREDVLQEVEDALGELFHRLAPKCPGILFVEKPLQDFENNTRYAFLGHLSLKKNYKKEGDLMIEYFGELERIYKEEEDIIWSVANLRQFKIGTRIKRIFELKPNWNGIGIDFSRFDDQFVDTNVLG